MKSSFIKGYTICLFSFVVFFAGCASSQDTEDTQFISDAQALLKEWCDGMLAVQINNPDDPTQHGALGCPACNKIHGRCMDAVYPFLCMADITGEKKYLDAGIAVFEWSKNVSRSDGSWTVIPDSNSWRGITVFGAIALAEALHYHGHLLEKERYDRWMVRLGKAGDYLYKNFDMTFTNINYGYTAIYALNIIGHLMENEKFIARSREMATEIKDFLTEPNLLLFGEGKPSRSKSPKGLYPVDLGYNVEESLNGVVLYALHEKDEELIALLQKSLSSHLEFMLPDGAWDNSWGSRHAKWSYWGSRTTDGCQVGFGILANRQPNLGTAAVKSTELLKQCTNNGLLHGGPHYVSHGVKPCVHHTFAHAKPLAYILDNKKMFTEVNAETPLPRSIADGVKEFPEIATFLQARGDWRATVTSYDVTYKKNIRTTTGGTMSVLYNNKVGLLCAASMPEYIIVEKNNCQPNPGEDFAFAPRVEGFLGDKWYTNLYDFSAKVNVADSAGVIQSDIFATLKDEKGEIISETAADFELQYLINENHVEFRCKPSGSGKISKTTNFVLPIISVNKEKVTFYSENKLGIQKKGGEVIIEANTAISIKEMEGDRIFNMVPGAEALPIIIAFPQTEGFELTCKLSVK